MNREVFRGKKKGGKEKICHDKPHLLAMSIGDYIIMEELGAGATD